MSFGRYARRRKKRRRAWAVEGGGGVNNAGAMIAMLAHEADKSMEETAEALERLETQGWIRRQADGSIVLLSRTDGESA